LFEAKTPEQAEIALKRLSSPEFLAILQRMANERGFREPVTGRFKGEKVGDRRVRVNIQGVAPEKIRSLEEALVELYSGKMPEADRQRLTQMSQQMREQMEKLKQLGARLPANFFEQQEKRLEPIAWELESAPLRKLR
jgi:hypothetical protein